MSEKRQRRQIKVLLVEDSPDDAELMKDALLEASLTVIHVAEDGEDAVAFLHREGKHTNAIRPDLILLDLHLPRKNGHEVLSELKNDPSLRQIPIVIMTSSENEEDFVTAYNLCANCCVAKPDNDEQFTEVVERIERFWLSVAKRPPNP